ncbi:MAG: hypothetical protein RLZZ227_142 [Pseudomonadota bacterium]|jgi:hypothetical protein
MRSRSLFVLATLCLSASALAHHSFFGRFDTGDVMYLEGEVTRVQWRNPHAHIVLKTIAEDGSVSEWDMESGSPTLMFRAGIPQDAIQPGMKIRVAGYPPLTPKKEMFATNVLLESGQELVLQTGAQAKFGDNFIGDFSYRFRTEGDRSRPDLGLFRVWTFTGSDGFLFPESIDRNYDLDSYPMTEAARQALARFNPATDNPTNNCTPKGMPLIMEQPLPMEILRAGDAVVLRIEEYDLRRTIHLDQSAAPAGTAPSPLGYSVGHWEGDTLVATTTHINWPHFNQAGIPQSEAVIITERFTPIEDGSQMEYQMTVTDPATFTRPVTLRKKWLHVPDEEIIPFNCAEP